jgi:aspartate dehydrogenase
MQRKRIGIIGAGVIGKAIHDDLVNNGLAEVAYILVSGTRPASDRAPELQRLMLSDPEAALARPVDLVVEAAHPDVLAALAPRILASADLCGFSCSALSRPETEQAIHQAARAGGRRFFLPHGAVLGLDGLVDGREIIDEVTITTTKSETSLGLEKGTSGVVFDGTAREVCSRFPRNVNVHAAIAIAGIGFDGTRSVVVAEPGTSAMRHRIQVSGQGIAWDFAVTSQSLGGVSGAYTPRSAVGSVRRILAGSGLVNC